MAGASTSPTRSTCPGTRSSTPTASRAGWSSSTPIRTGGMSLDPNFFLDFGDQRRTRCACRAATPRPTPTASRRPAVLGPGATACRRARPGRSVATAPRKEDDHARTEHVLALALAGGPGRLSRPESGDGLALRRRPGPARAAAAGGDGGPGTDRPRPRAGHRPGRRCGRRARAGHPATAAPGAGRRGAARLRGLQGRHPLPPPALGRHAGQLRASWCCGRSSWPRRTAPG